MLFPRPSLLRDRAAPRRAVSRGAAQRAAQRLLRTAPRHRAASSTPRRLLPRSLAPRGARAPQQQRRAARRERRLGAAKGAQTPAAAVLLRQSGRARVEGPFSRLLRLNLLPLPLPLPLPLRSPLRSPLPLPLLPLLLAAPLLLR